MENYKFLFKAQKEESKEWVIGRVGYPTFVENGTEITTYFWECVETEDDFCEWNRCVVLANTITPLDEGERTWKK